MITLCGALWILGSQLLGFHVTQIFLTRIVFNNALLCSFVGPLLFRSSAQLAKLFLLALWCGALFFMLGQFDVFVNLPLILVCFFLFSSAPGNDAPLF